MNQTFFQPLSPPNPVIENHPSYRRLTNIVHSHHYHPSAIFRNNLIKELYFLLQIVPIIQPHLITHFLTQIQNWYDSNDHKKIQLASRKLQSVVHTYVSSKDRYDTTNNTRITPQQHSILKAIHPVLRPYTAKSVLTSKRPLSHNQPSTIASTHYYQSNIEQEIQRSKDFRKKHRTIHPQQQPAYQQLMNIVNRPQTSQLKPNNKLYPRNNNSSLLPLNSNLKYQNHQNSTHNIQIIQLGDQSSSNSNSSSHQHSPNYHYKVFSKQKPRPQTGLTRTLNRQQLLNNHLNLENKLIDQQIFNKKIQYISNKSRNVNATNRKTQSNRILKFKRNIKSANALQHPNHISLNQSVQSNQSTYNVKQFFQPKIIQSVKKFRRNINSAPKKLLQNHINGSTTNHQLTSNQKFNPISITNVNNFNEEVLADIIKIKQKLGGENYIDTNTMMKGLYINSYNNTDFHQKDYGWSNIDKGYLMVKSGIKKKKRNRINNPKKNGK